METTRNATANAVRKEVSISAITVDKIYKADYQKDNTLTAQLRQTVKTVSFYPSKQVGSSLKDSPFTAAECGFQEEQYPYTEKRVAWVNVPVSVSADDVLGKIPAEAVLYKMISNRPILSDHQLYSIENGLKTMDEYSDAQVVRYGEGSDNAGQLILDLNNKPQYRAIFYSNSPKKDVELRTEVASDFYASPKIKGEMLGVQVMPEQTL
jgi:hypothetical protein